MAELADVSMRGITNAGGPIVVHDGRPDVGVNGFPGLRSDCDIEATHFGMSASQEMRRLRLWRSK